MSEPFATTRWSVFGLVKPPNVLKLIRSDFGRRVARFILTVSPILLFIAVWWAYAEAKDVPRIYPSPWLVGEEFWGILKGGAPEVYGGTSYDQIWATVRRLLLAVGISLVIGAAIGLIIGRSKLAFDLFDNIGWIMISVPLIVWTFLFLVIMGFTDVVVLSAMTALLLPNVALLVGEGAKATPADLLEMATSFHASRWQKVRDVFVPHLLPYLMASARVTFSVGVKVIVLAEVVGVTKGIGYMMKFWLDQVYLAPIIAWGLVLIILGLIVEYAVFVPLERWVTKWRTVGTSPAGIPVD